MLLVTNGFLLSPFGLRALLRSQLVSTFMYTVSRMGLATTAVNIDQHWTKRFAIFERCRVAIAIACRLDSLERCPNVELKRAFLLVIKGTRTLLGTPGPTTRNNVRY